ncbi:NAD-dependent epimerase/dehydratase family protein [Candidatus Pelagibacter sp.]|nr:NAD-dependent epimerase/dehydratase family protein [Candidatus Pelagibacter sp.]
MKIFITGTAGFIGFNLAKSLLENNHTVCGYDGITNYYDVKLKNSRNKILKNFKKYSFTKGMLENKDLLKKTLVKFKPEIIIHLAAQAGVRYSIDKPRTYLSSNIIGSYNVIELAHKVKVKHLMIASSSSIYGANKKTPYNENDSVRLQMSIYASTKLATESIAHSYSNVWRIPTTSLRFFTVYGPWGRPDMALFKFTKSILEGKKIDIYNKGNLYRDFTYIDDVVDAISSLIKKTPKYKKDLSLNKIDTLSSVAPFRTVNIGNSKKIKLLDFIKAIEANLGKKALRNYMPMQKGDVFMTLANTKLLKKITGIRPKTNYKEGVRKFIKWYLDYYGK